MTILTALIAGCGGGENSSTTNPAPSTTKTDQNLSFGTAPSLVAGGSVVVSASASSGLAVSYISLTPAICSVNATTGMVNGLLLGTCTVAAYQAGNDSYQPAPQVTQSLSVVPNPAQSIQFIGGTPTLVAGDTATVFATANSGLTVSYGSATPNLCTIDSNTHVVTALAAGVCSITADQAGNTTYNAAPQATLAITIASWSGPITAPGQPGSVAASDGTQANTVQVSWGSTSSGGSPITGFTAISSPSGYTASGSHSPLVVSCSNSCKGESFAVQAINAIGPGQASAAAHVLTTYAIVTTFREPNTSPNDTIFTGTFELNSTTNTIVNLKGSITQSMTGRGGMNANAIAPMSTVALNHQLITRADADGGYWIASFAQNSIHTLTIDPLLGGSDGWSPGAVQYYGYTNTGVATNPNPGNTYVLVYVNPNNPLAALTQTQINKLAYADCASGGMMGSACMTGTTVNGYGRLGSMGGYPLSQVISR